MKFSEKWLREWVDPSMDTDTLAHRLTMIGHEVDGLEPQGDSLDGVVVGDGEEPELAYAVVDTLQLVTRRQTTNLQVLARKVAS